MLALNVFNEWREFVEHVRAFARGRYCVDE
jgi:hypothetical protein